MINTMIETDIFIKIKSGIYRFKSKMIVFNPLLCQVRRDLYHIALEPALVALISTLVSCCHM